MKRIHSAGLCLAAALFAAPAIAADDILVIPDTTAAYLYDSAGSRRTLGNQSSLALIKDGSFKEYRIESSPPGFVCDEKCPETAQNMPEGKVTLRIVGKKPIAMLNIPLTGKWSNECTLEDAGSDAESAKCVVQLSDMTEPIHVEVNPDVTVGTLFPLPEGGQAMIVKIDPQEGYVMVAGHQLLSEGMTWLDFDKNRRTAIGANNLLDGRVNMPKLLTAGSWAASYCASLASGDWYLPARNELALMTPEAMQRISGLITDTSDTVSGYTWTSTENSFDYSKGRKATKYTMTHQANALNNSSVSIHTDRDAYKCTFEQDGTTPCTNIRRYQVLCFRRLPV